MEYSTKFYVTLIMKSKMENEISSLEGKILCGKYRVQKHIGTTYFSSIFSGKLNNENRNKFRVKISRCDKNCNSLLLY